MCDKKSSDIPDTWQYLLLGKLAYLSEKNLPLN